MFTDYLDGPDLELWNERKDWIEKIFDDETALGGYSISEQACALTMDLINPDNPEITVDDQWFKREEMEIEARRAIGLVAMILFLTPWV